MRYDTQQSIHDAQKAITELRDNDSLTTRSAVARQAGKSTSWITKLVKQFPEYINDDGSGSLIIIQDIKAPPKLPPRPAAINPAVTNGELNNAMMLNRIAEALETMVSIASRPNDVRPEISKPPSRPIKDPLIPVETWRKITERMKEAKGWDKVDEYRDNLHLNLIDLYLLWVNMEKYLNKNKAELIKQAEARASGETKLENSKPARLPIGHVYQRKNGSGRMQWDMIIGYSEDSEHPYFIKSVDELVKFPDKLTLLGELAVENAAKVDGANT